MLRRRSTSAPAMIAGLWIACLTGSAQAQDANPYFSFYGYGMIVANPSPAIVGENTIISVTVSNNGTEEATNVRVKLSYNDWGVTFFGWQEIDTQTVDIPAFGSQTLTFNKTFENGAHTCLEVLIVGADANTNPNDDRGQINLEVVHAGQEFSYGVPIRNQGNQPLDLLVDGQWVDREGGQPAANAQIRLEGIDPDSPLHLEPGAERMVQVVGRFAPGTPAGAAVAFDVIARDLVRGGDLDYVNHVRLVIVRQTARGLKTAALAQLEAASAAAPDRGLSQQIRAIGEHLRRSLDSKHWNGDDRLKPNGGASVLAQEQAAARQLEGTIRHPRSAEVRVLLDSALRNLTDADRILAETAVIDAGRPAGPSSSLAEGDTARQAGAYADAVHAYASSWRAATR